MVPIPESIPVLDHNTPIAYRCYDSIFFWNRNWNRNHQFLKSDANPIPESIAAWNHNNFICICCLLTLAPHHHCSPEALPVEALEEGVGEEVGQHRRGGCDRDGGGGGLRRGQGPATATTPRTGTETSARG